MGVFDWLRGPPQCPIDPGVRSWIDQRWDWLIQVFGIARIRKSPLFLPRHEHFPDPYAGTDADVQMLLQRVCVYMDLDPTVIELSIFSAQNPIHTHPLFIGSSPGAAGYYEDLGGRYRIWIEESLLHDPLVLVATMAHELCHVHLLGHQRIPPETEDQEPLTDLLTVYLGFGLITANAVVRDRNLNQGAFGMWVMSRHGYLTMQDYGYALALFARARDEFSPAWARELRPDVRAAFKASMRLLDAEEETDPTDATHG